MGDVTRIWLTEWEWACCGDAFTVGDTVDLGIASRAREPWLTELLGTELAATVDAVESHHEEEFAERLRGQVTAVHRVTHELAERRYLRRAGHGAPPNAVMPPEGDEWPMVGRGLGNGFFVGSRPSRYVVELSPVPGTAALEAAPGVRLPEPDRDAAEPSTHDDGGDDPAAERTARALAGWLVDVDERSADRPGVAAEG